jgi:hypothetical protein
MESAGGPGPHAKSPPVTASKTCASPFAAAQKLRAIDARARARALRPGKGGSLDGAGPRGPGRAHARDAAELPRRGAMIAAQLSRGGGGQAR